MSYFGTQDPFVIQAINEISSTYSATVSVKAKKKSLLKFGGIASTDGTTEQTIANLQGSTLRETYATTNSVDSLITDDTGTNTSTIFVEGHTISGGNLTFTTQSKALTSQTRVALDTALARVTRLYTTTGSGNTASKLVYAYDSTVAATPASGVPNVASATKCTMDFIEFQSQKCATSISSTDYWIISDIYASIFKNANGSAIIRFRHGAVGQNLRTQAPKLYLDSDSGPVAQVHFSPYLIVPANSDVEMTVEASASGVAVSAGASGYLASVVS